MEKIEFLSIVMLKDWYIEHLKEIKFNPFGKDTMFIYLGEIPNMPGHCVVIGHGSGKVYSGYHTEDFRLPRENEI
jgi:hypothetical protein